MNYVTKNLSSFYLDFIKDILYIHKFDSTRRRQVQTVLYEQLW
ncbi:Isoleucine--tRNA ligase, partial [Mycoplasma putrefaciens]